MLVKGKQSRVYLLPLAEMLQNLTKQLEKLQEAPPTVFYVPDFISEEEEAHIVKNVYAAPKPKWTCLSSRRLQDYGGVPHKNGMIPEKIPEWLQLYMDKISNYDPFNGNKPNHVLINEYLPGQGIMPHTDGPLFYPAVTTISCGSHASLEILEGDVNRKRVCQIFLERRSLIMWRDDVYSNYLHSISQNNEDVIGEDCVNINKCKSGLKIGHPLKRETRISVTVRCVKKVCKMKLSK